MNIEDIKVIRPIEVSVIDIIYDYVYDHNVSYVRTKNQFLNLFYGKLVPELKGKLTEEEENKCYYLFLSACKND